MIASELWVPHNMADAAARHIEKDECKRILLSKFPMSYDNGRWSEPVVPKNKLMSATLGGFYHA